MSSDRDGLIAALDAIDAGCRSIAAFPMETLSRSEGHALLGRLEKLDQKLILLQRSLKGRLVTVARDRRTPA